MKKNLKIQQKISKMPDRPKRIWGVNSTKDLFE